MDIWLKPDNENRDKLIEALKEFGVLQTDLKELATKDFSKIQFFYFGTKPQRIDFLNRISGVAFDEVESVLNYFPLGDIKVPIIQYHHLILSKISNERGKDKTDVEELQKINKFRK